MNRWIAAVCVALVGAAAWAFDLPEAEHFARRPAIASVVVSPDGAHLAAVLSPDGDERVIAIWQADALTEAPFIVGSDPRSEVQSVRFLTSDRMLVVTQQLVDHNPFTGRTERSYGSFQRAFTLPCRVDETGMTAPTDDKSP
jgi:hypothetical protein